MPTVSIGRDRLFEALGKTYSQLTLSTSNHNFFLYLNSFIGDIDHVVLVCIESISTAQEEFEELCFSFGIELDDVVSACISFSFWLLILKCLISLFKFFFSFFEDY